MTPDGRRDWPLGPRDVDRASDPGTPRRVSVTCPARGGSGLPDGQAWSGDVDGDRAPGCSEPVAMTSDNAAAPVSQGGDRPERREQPSPAGPRPVPRQLVLELTLTDGNR